MSDKHGTAIEHFDNLSTKYEVLTGGCTRELARYLIGIAPSFAADSKVLDNACGNGIVAQEILSKNPNVPLSIACTDGASGMVDLARHAVQVTKSAVTLSFDVVPGENLTFPDDHFTHSITNQGILFFKDGVKGAQGIYRTLKPGGIAIVTTWKDLGYMKPIHQAQKVVKPDAALFRIPISEDWFSAAYLEKTLSEAGLQDVKVHEKKVHYAAKSVEDICGNLVNLFSPFLKGWSDEEIVEFKKELKSAAEKVAVKVDRPVVGKEGEVEEVVGIEMIALVAVASK
ncbi:S-adenosyl-L-methionine-dependent methyltransferase [Cucurbitaria berberidis CBS 394.84]|uniref:S-adenosyl-L-methionine-dependent methyltransferase n=1 Tax=Cucurbitaria berberidis CBS 394.84 TaxID=1168544 RepID=A0A9P4L9N6_9PLEO|nr:S-adenosyl-L-methionine-dependent methyltransferase [Cucurbitaria berberidis CBS 394.84]KAF1846547.1 S-adenosyl-L-methionine-dependent methyltransferase [Cucurbitaria berberidis CBS 394.84]